MRVLGIDYGTVRVGLAISDPMGIIAHPLETIQVTSLKKTVEAIAAVIEKNKVEKVVVGLPKHMSGDESESSKKARELGTALQERVKIPLAYYDERMSTCAAERAMIDADVSRKKRREKIDTVAASIILQSYLDMFSET